MGPQVTEPVFTTDDMTLVAYLRVRGRTEYRLSHGEKEGKAVWIFPDIGDLIGIVDEFYDGDAEVEPRKFNKSIRKTRDELYDFLGIGRHNGRNGR
jgi:hypothetical protein